MKLHIAILVLLISSFGLACSNNPKTIVFREVEHSETREFMDFWKVFSTEFSSVDTVSIRSITLDSIWLWGDLIPSNEFINRYSSGYSSSSFPEILDTNRAMYSSIGCHPSPPIKEAIRRQYSDACNCDKVLVVQDTVGSTVEGIEFSFLQTTKGYRLFGIAYSSAYWQYDLSLPDTTTQAR